MIKVNCFNGFLVHYDSNQWNVQVKNESEKWFYLHTNINKVINNKIKLITLTHCLSSNQNNIGIITFHIWY